MTMDPTMEPASMSTGPDSMPVQTPEGSEMPACEYEEFTQYCPDRDGVKAACWRPNVDCESIGHCNGSVVACVTDFVVDCSFPNYCVPRDDKCNDTNYPQFCPANGGAGPVCAQDEGDCKTLAWCAGQAQLCLTGFILKCDEEKGGDCVPVATDGGADGGRPQIDASSTDARTSPADSASD